MAFESYVPIFWDYIINVKMPYRFIPLQVIAIEKFISKNGVKAL
jgi:hypothetical protein